MYDDSSAADATLLELLRMAGPLEVLELAETMQIAPAAARRRLGRLLAQELIRREAIRNGRGRPKHRYLLSDKGARFMGSKFDDLDVALGEEVRQIGDPASRREALRRIARVLAAGHSLKTDIAPVGLPIQKANDVPTARDGTRETDPVLFSELLVGEQFPVMQMTTL